MDSDTEFGKWKCSACTLINKESHTCCIVCRTRRPTKNIRDYQFGTVGGKTVSHCQAAVSREWQCSECTFINKESDIRCTICRSRRPTTNITYYQLGAEGGKAVSQCQTAVSSAVGGKAVSQCQVAVSREWQCNRCAAKNNDKSSVCKACFGKRPPNELRFVIIGKSGSGKSATGNTILNQMHFKSMVSGGSVTNKCEYGHAFRMGRKLVVIDTPALFDTGFSYEIATCIKMTAPGPHAVLLTVNVGRFTKEDEDTVTNFVNHFGEDLYRYLIVVFTKADELERENISIRDYVNRSPPAIQKVLDQCGEKYIPFNNRHSKGGKEQQVQNLVALVDDIVNQNGGQFYSNEMYAKAEETMQRRDVEIRQQLEKEECMKIDNIRQEYEQKRRNQNKIGQENIIQMKRDQERREAMIKEEYERKMEASALRDSSRQEVQQESSFFYHLSEGIKSVVQGIKESFLK